MKFEVIPGEITPGDTVNLDVTGVGPMTLQIGANENQTMDVRIQEISSQTLYIDKVNVCTVTGASRAITSFDGAIAKVSEVRSSIGARKSAGKFLFLFLCHPFLLSAQNLIVLLQKLQYLLRRPD